MPTVSGEATPQAKPYELWLAAFLLALLAARLLANAFARTDLVFDEAQYWTWSRELDFGYFSKPPMLAWLIRGTTELAAGATHQTMRAEQRPSLHMGSHTAQTRMAIQALTSAVEPD